MTDDDLRTRLDRAFNREGDLCAELVVRTLAEASDRDAVDAVRMASGFCSGVSRTCGQCGAVSGAVMGLGLYAGATAESGDYDQIYTLVQEFRERFEAAFGSVGCLDLIGCDFGSAEGQRRYRSGNVRERCLDFVVFAVQAALFILREHGYLEPEEGGAGGRPCL